MSVQHDGPGEQVRQDVRAARDSFAAARDLTVNFYSHAPVTGQPEAPRVTGRVWGNVPPRNPGFTGRDGLLRAVRKALLARNRTAVQALHGMGGVGKTQLAVEYAYRYSRSYDLVWWMLADQAGLMGDQFMALGESLGCVLPGAVTAETARQATFSELRRRDKWLLVFDNAESPADLAHWMPGGNGHVLITSRTRRWAEIAAPVEVDVLTRSESVAILRGQILELADADAGLVAEAMGDLPLGVAQAAGFMADTGTPAAEYLDLLRTQAGKVLGYGQPPSYPLPLAAVTHLAFDRLRSDNPASASLAGVCAFLAPELVPREWFTRDPAQLPPDLAGAASDKVAWSVAVGRLGAHALARVDQDGLRMHRLTQAILRDYLPPDKRAASKAAAGAVVAASHPGDGKTPSTWPGWARLLPHLLATHPETTANERLRRLAVNATWYLAQRGNWENSYSHATRLFQRWHEDLGAEDAWTLSAGQAVAVALWGLGRYSEAREREEDILARRRRVLGRDHQDTLAAANITAIILHTLGESEAARKLSEDTLVRRRRVLGEDHPDTIKSVRQLDTMKRAGQLAARPSSWDLQPNVQPDIGPDVWPKPQGDTGPAVWP